MDQLYLHLDGWGQPGYDNQHPDYLPPCKEAGGWEGMKELSDTMRELGYMFGVHDQYRDYYMDAPTYDTDNAAMSVDGTLFELARWAGGRQNFLCASLALTMCAVILNSFLPTASIWRGLTWMCSPATSWMSASIPITP